MNAERPVRADEDRCRTLRGSPPNCGFFASCKPRCFPGCRTPDGEPRPIRDDDGGGDAWTGAVGPCLALAADVLADVAVASCVGC